MRYVGRDGSCFYSSAPVGERHSITRVVLSVGASVISRCSRHIMGTDS